MDEELVRNLVRESIARHLGSTAAAAPHVADDQPPPSPTGAHASHFRYLLVGSGGPCLIEPTVQCNHCGYCESHGH